MKLPGAQQLPTLNDCVHCGLCLPDCPTYRVTGREIQSPRGRIAALRGLVEERIEPSRSIREGLEDCLICRACESACPSGISMESMMAAYRETTRPQVADTRTRLERWWLDQIVAQPHRLATFARLTRYAAPLARRLGLEVPGPQRLTARGASPAAVPAMEETRGIVVMLRGCVADHWFRDETLAAAHVLARNGWHVKLPDSGCCGALQRHAGLIERSEHLQSRLLQRLEAERPDYIVVDSAGCAAALLEHGSGDAAARIIDTPSLLAREGWRPPARKLPGRWAIFPPCHQRHGARLEDGSRFEDHTTSILAQVLEHSMTLPGNELCCGAAGTFGQRRASLSRSVGEVALERFVASSASGIVTGNPGCLLRWEWLLGSEIEVAHPVILLDRAYRQATDSPAS